MLKYIILGIVQGATEFFPVSSSGHLVMAQKILNLSAHPVGLSVVLHLGTVLALLVFFFKDILELLKDIRLIFKVAVVTLITGAIGLSGKGFFEGLFGSPKAAAIALIFTGAILLLTKKFKGATRENVRFPDAIVLGLAQGLAIIPGLSRSGVTISVLLFRGIAPEASFRFSFLAAIPAVCGAAILERKDISLALKGNLGGLSAGFIFSFLSGLLCLWMLRKILAQARLYYFGYYCIIVAVLVLLLLK